ncbi:glycoside hydrolase family 78 protein [Phanerochaete carnosa HHB-10118-sp]|uniref:Glycoside hydrolase family 78 protein n=1 Tax=Phanerochaete carnosa (strain HHB-10118-sp) TaxID=650164 RepID=K5WR71_PHACS|nr:glycoside hydrolase family 78 protein [Phanerochaete carnosa HHB-10118-sp]EKM52842.1 glycoside hydrolase family 78 protein [Phanerochaete carnosa HHB-10118-sp]
MRLSGALLVLLSAAATGRCAAPSGPWDTFNLAPATRVVRPTGLKEVVGAVQNAQGLLSETGAATFSGNESWLTLDFGKEVGGLISMTLESASPSSSLALSFTESPMFISPLTSDDSSNSAPNMSYDGVLHLQTPLQPGLWTQPSVRLRGGFRYLTLVSTSNAAIAVSNVSCSISFMPHVDNMREYSGYFYASDPVFHDKDFLTKACAIIWYSGAYTVQTDTVPLHTGRQIPAVSSPGWANNATLGVAGPIIVDGAKRDRAVWPGDMGVAVPTQFVSTNDLVPTRNALSTMFAATNPLTGALPESGPPLSQMGSDTYHMWTLIGAHNYVRFSGDTVWLSGVWANYTKAVGFVLGKVDSSGLMNVTGLRDWGRLESGGHNAEGNALLYQVSCEFLSTDLANTLNDSALAANWSSSAAALKTRFNEAFWLPSAGMYSDNETTTLCPQDANSMSVLYNLTTSAEQANSVSEGLTKYWNDLGAIAPELPDNISPFIGSLELQAHFQSGNDLTAMDLLRREWGYMLYTNLSVQSTLLEGFTSNGSLYYRSYQGYSYDASYTSHSHGWSSGPTSALTFYVLGLTVTSNQGRTWSIAPHTSGLSAAQGGFETPLGWYGVQWSLEGKTFKLSVDVPAETSGTVRLPLAGTVTVDGKSTSVGGGAEISLAGGNHSIVVQS